MDRQEILNELTQVYKNLSPSSLEKTNKILDILGVDKMVGDETVRLYCYATVASSVESVENAMYGLKTFTPLERQKFRQILLNIKLNS
ncbi:MAG: hypothetical protein KAS32_19930 [Candidatus Peribacteraceae bacterium]|nr:hypothetical protein [Candidatus Peribacteraceae bacterium]